MSLFVIHSQADFENAETAKEREFVFLLWIILECFNIHVLIITTLYNYAYQIWIFAFLVLGNFSKRWKLISGKLMSYFDTRVLQKVLLWTASQTQKEVCFTDFVNTYSLFCHTSTCEISKESSKYQLCYWHLNKLTSVIYAGLYLRMKRKKALE